MSSYNLRLFDCYRQVLHDGNTVKCRDLEMVDLRVCTKKWKDHPTPKIQVYKMNRDRKEVNEIFDDPDKAIAVFLRIKNRGQA